MDFQIQDGFLSCVLTAKQIIIIIIIIFHTLKKVLFKPFREEFVDWRLTFEMTLFCFSPPPPPPPSSRFLQFEIVSQHLVFANCIPLILKFFNQNIMSYISAKNR